MNKDRIHKLRRTLSPLETAEFLTEEEKALKNFEKFYHLSRDSATLQ